jgi:hypothetical protein
MIEYISAIIGIYMFISLLYGAILLSAQQQTPMGILTNVSLLKLWITAFTLPLPIFNVWVLGHPVTWKRR